MSVKRELDSNAERPPAKRVAPPHLSFHLPTSREFKLLIAAVLPLRTEANITFSSAGLSAFILDSAHVCIIKLDLPAAKLADYQCERTVTLGIDLGELARTLGSVHPTDALYIRHTYGSTKFTLRTVASDERDKQGQRKFLKKTCTYNLNLYDYEEQAIGVPDVQHHVRIRLDSASYDTIIKDLFNVGETVALEAWPTGQCRFSITSQEAAQADIRLDPDAEFAGYTCVATHYAKALYSLRKLAEFSLASKLSKTVHIAFSHDSNTPGEVLPIQLTFPFSLGSLEYFLAPQLEDN